MDIDSGICVLGASYIGQDDATKYSNILADLIKAGGQVVSQEQAKKAAAEKEKAAKEADKPRAEAEAEAKAAATRAAVAMADAAAAKMKSDASPNDKNLKADAEKKRLIAAMASADAKAAAMKAAHYGASAPSQPTAAEVEDMRRRMEGGGMPTAVKIGIGAGVAVGAAGLLALIVKIARRK